MRNAEKPKDMETSKKILLVLFIFWVLFTVFGGFLACAQGNDSVITILASGLVSALTVGVGFYYWKARAENVIKLRNIYGDDETKKILEDSEEDNYGA